MPHNHDDTGGLSVGQRIGRLEEEYAAHAEHCEITRKEIWNELTAMKIRHGEDMKAVAVDAAKAQVKIAMIVGVLSAVGSTVLGLIVHFLLKG